MKQKWFKVGIFLLVLAFTFVLRAHNYERVPTAGHLDEMLYAWSGIYLVETGAPVSWSTLDYPKRAEVFSGELNYRGGIPKAGVTLYKPWLDEPPLFSYLVGFFAHQFGASREGFIPASNIRFPVVFISAATGIVVFLLAEALSGYWMGIVAMLLYGTVPLIVFASRTALPENLIALVLVGALYLLLRFKREKKLGYLLPIPVMIGIAGLSKPTGFLLLPLVAYLVFKWSKSWRFGAYLLLATLPFVAAYFWWGIHWDAEIFWQINAIQSHRPIGFGALAGIFSSPAYATTEFMDSWVVFGMLVGVYFLLTEKNEERKLVLWAFVYWLLVVVTTGGQRDLLAWYRFPVWPLLAIIMAWGLKELTRKVDFFKTALAAGFLLGNRMLFVNAFNPDVTATAFRLILMALVAPILMYGVYRKRWLYKLSVFAVYFAIVWGIYLNASYTYQAFDIECQGMECPIVESTWLSELSMPTPVRQILLRLPKSI